MNTFDHSIGIATIAGMVAMGMTLPAIAKPAPQRIAQHSLCRAAKVSTPVFAQDNVTSVTLRIVPKNQQVTLKAIPPQGSQFAQITVPVSGYIQTAMLKPCQTSVQPLAQPTGQPPAIDTDPAYCRRLRDSTIDGKNYKDLDAGLVARAIPQGGFLYVGNRLDGPARAAVLHVTQLPPKLEDDGIRRWIFVRFTSVSGAKRLGWIANGPSGINRNLAHCLPGQQ
jgi:hypothetical protein